MLNIINIVKYIEEKISKQIDSAVSTVKKVEEKNRVARRKSVEVDEYIKILLYKINYNMKSSVDNNQAALINVSLNLI